MYPRYPLLVFFFSNDPPPTEIYPLPLPDALPILMNSPASIAVAPAAGFTSSFAICPSDLPSRRSEQKRMTQSCTAPPTTTPITSHSVPGRKPNCEIGRAHV